MALRALRGLVKFQALVKGFLVRKRVAAILYSMQALLRAQLVVHSQRAQLSVRSQLAVQPQMCHRQSTDPTQKEMVENDSTRMRSCMSASGKEQNKHAIAIAATAAADASVSGPQALVAVVRLSSDGRGTLFSGREKWAATKIQLVYRGHLAKKALRALRGLMKFQALVKGFLVRKRVATTLYIMQALLRAQLVVRSQRAHLVVRSQLAIQPQMRHRQSTIRSLL
ncbi:IQ-DOMAIN 31-like protein [Tanacetum coccineum]